MSASPDADLRDRVAELERQVRDLRARLAVLERGPASPRMENPEDRKAVREKVAYDWQA